MTAHFAALSRRASIASFALAIGCGDGGSAGSAANMPSPPDTSEHAYEADDPNIQYTGRVDFSNPKRPRFASAGTYITVKFKGVAAALLLEDENRYGSERNFYDVSVDGNAPFKLRADKASTQYELVRDLPYGEHEVRVVKRTEANIGYSDLLGFKFMGTIAEPPARPSHRIVVIGDSITCGAGDEAGNNSTQCSENGMGEAGGWGQPYHNANAAYGPVMARALDADYHLTSVSGIGLVRNYSMMYDARPMPEVYDLTFLELTTSPSWDHQQFSPDVIVIALGTNDFSPGDNPPDDPRPSMDVAMYTEAYIAFVEKLRGYHPDAHIFGISSPMLSDGWPASTDTFATDLKTSLDGVVSHFEAAGDDKVHEFFVTKVSGAGCGTHPDVAQHAAMAAEVGEYVRSVMGW